MTRSDAEATRILHARAVALAGKREIAGAAGERLELLEFKLAAEAYAIERRHVQGVHPLQDLTPLPGTPPFVLGIVNVRGRILPVLDLKKFFELPEQGLTDLHRIVLVRGHDMELGLLADVIVDVREVAVATLQPSLPTLTGIRADFLKGIGPDGLIVLDLDRVLSDPKIVVHQEPDA